MSKAMNVLGATTSNEDGQSGTRDILFPNQVEDVDEIAIDIGGTLSKVTYFSRKKGGAGGRLHFHRFPTESINDFISFVGGIINDRKGNSTVMSFWSFWSFCLFFLSFWLSFLILSLDLLWVWVPLLLFFPTFDRLILGYLLIFSSFSLRKKWRSWLLHPPFSSSSFAFHR